mmetsp:Transcript_2678/g.5530  ORF Transcript_2678/g.5530 Transcript_2678/m.5530 type:complete len:208 (+) Transcript_2678:749-1372(+)
MQKRRPTCLEVKGRASLLGKLKTRRETKGLSSTFQDRQAIHPDLSFLHVIGTVVVEKTAYREYTSELVFCEEKKYKDRGLSSFQRISFQSNPCRERTLIGMTSESERKENSRRVVDSHQVIFLLDAFLFLFLVTVSFHPGASWSSWTLDLFLFFSFFSRTQTIIHGHDHGDRVNGDRSIKKKSLSLMYSRTFYEDIEGRIYLKRPSQ